jgi:hypothetical protein
MCVAIGPLGLIGGINPAPVSRFTFYDFPNCSSPSSQIH